MSWTYWHSTGRSKYSGTEVLDLPFETYDINIPKDLSDLNPYKIYKKSPLLYKKESYSYNWVFFCGGQLTKFLYSTMTSRKSILPSVRPISLNNDDMDLIGYHKLKVKKLII